MESIKDMWSMKKKSNNHMKVYHTECFEELPISKEFAYPFKQELLNLLKRQNKCKQEYYYLEDGESYAFFVLYHNRMNIFTFGKVTLYYPLKVIGFPCSLSCPGYVTNDMDFLLDYVATIKGAKLILNVSTPTKNQHYVLGETLPTCILELTYGTIDQYMNSLRSSYRRRMQKAIKACVDVQVKNNVNDARIHDLYLNTYNKSDYQLERLEKGFFDEVDADKLIFYREDKPIGFVLLKGNDEQLIFMFCGMDYTNDTTDLYYFMIYHIVKYGIEHHFKRIDLGQTSEETKMKFGSCLEKKFFYANHTNKFINFLIKHGKGLLEYHYSFPEFHVFKDEEQKNEGIIV